MTRAVAFTIGLLLMVAYCPALSGATTTLRWDVAALIALALFFAPIGRLTSAHWFGGALLAWLIASIAWSSAPYYGVNTAAQCLAAAVAFAFGATLLDIRPLIAGAAVGLAISSLVAVGQWFGLHVIDIDPFGWFGWAPVDIKQYGYPGGLFYNGNRLAEVAVLVLVAAVATRMWWFIPALLPAIWLPQARGAWLALAAAGLVWFWQRGKTFDRFMLIAMALQVAFFGAMVAPLIDVPFKTAAVLQRLDLGSWTIGNLTLLGHGLGSFGLDSPVYSGATLAQTQYPHNEFLWIAYEGGLVGAVLALVFGTSVVRGAAVRGELSLVLVALGVIACFGMPFHDPATALFAALVAGFAVGADGRVRAAADAGGRGIYGRHPASAAG